MRGVDVVGIDDELLELPVLLIGSAGESWRGGARAVADRDLEMAAVASARGEVHPVRDDAHAFSGFGKSEVGGIAGAGGGEKGGDGMSAAGGLRSGERRRGRGA